MRVRAGGPQRRPDPGETPRGAPQGGGGWSGAAGPFGVHLGGEFRGSETPRGAPRTEFRGSRTPRGAPRGGSGVAGPLGMHLGGGSGVGRRWRAGGGEPPAAGVAPRAGPAAA